MGVGGIWKPDVERKDLEDGVPSMWWLDDDLLLHVHVDKSLSAAEEHAAVRRAQVEAMIQSGLIALPGVFVHAGGRAKQHALPVAGGAAAIVATVVAVSIAAAPGHPSQAPDAAGARPPTVVAPGQPTPPPTRQGGMARGGGAPHPSLPGPSRQPSTPGPIVPVRLPSRPAPTRPIVPLGVVRPIKASVPSVHPLPPVRSAVLVVQPIVPACPAAPFHLALPSHPLRGIVLPLASVLTALRATR